MGDFKISRSKTDKNEGGYVNSLTDRGKETYRGITIVSHPHWNGWEIIHKVIADLGITNTRDAGREVWKRIDNALAAIPELDASVNQFYKMSYWDPLDLDNEPSQLICDKIYDISVNMGVGRAKEFLAEARKDEQNA